jgi:hypothetical protein
MPIVYRLVNSAGQLLADADSVSELHRHVTTSAPGRYTVDEIRDQPSPSGYTSRRWGVILHLAGGRIVEEPDPWER